MEQKIDNKKMLWLSLVGSILFLRANKSISLLDVAVAASSSIIRLEAKKLSSQHSKMIIIQSDIVSYAALCLVLWLITPVERDLFMNRIPDLKLLIASGALACLAFIFTRQSLPTTKQTATITASLICGVTSAILTSSGIPLLIVLISMVLIAMAAYNRFDEEPLIDQHYNDIITPRIMQQRNSYATQKLTGVIIVTFVLFLVHVQLQTLPQKIDYNTEQTTFKKPSVEILPIDFNDRSMPVGVRKQMRQQCLHKTRSLYIDQVSSMIRPNANFAVVHFPDHWNLGDAFIYNGQTTLWNIYGQIAQRSPTLVDNFKSYNLLITVSNWIRIVGTSSSEKLTNSDLLNNLS